MLPLDPNNPVRAVADETRRDDIVSVDAEAIQALPRPYDLAALTSVLPSGSPLAGNIESFVPYIVAMNTMNYQFWDIDANGTFVRYALGSLVGSHAMQDSFYRAWLEAVGGAKGCKTSSTEQVYKVEEALGPRLGRDGVEFLFGDIPAAQSRRELLLEVLNPERLSVISHFLTGRLQKYRTLDWRDAMVLASTYPQAYGDLFLKKAQLTLTFLAAAWNELHPKSPCELSITVSADYQLPKVMRTLGLLHYSEDLAAKVDNGVLIEARSEEENAIRSATVRGCDLLAEHFQVSIEAVDGWLWLNRNTSKDAKFHLTRTTAY